MRSTLFPAGPGGGVAGGNIAIYNPTAGPGNDVHQKIAARGEVRCLIAPNPFHHLDLRERLERYPGAEVFSSQTAASRIQRKTGLRPKPIDELIGTLPGGTRIFTPAGLKNGEAWVGLETASDRFLAVGDAFFSLAGPFRGLSRKNSPRHANRARFAGGPHLVLAAPPEFPGIRCMVPPRDKILDGGASALSWGHRPGSPPGPAPDTFGGRFARPGMTWGNFPPDTFYFHHL